MRTMQLIAMCFAASSCAIFSSGAQEVLDPVRLNQEKDAFHEKHVVVHGWMRATFENYALWQDAESEKDKKWSSCVSLMLPRSLDFEKLDKKFVELKGVFLEKKPEGSILLGGCNSSVIQVDGDKLPRVVEPAG